MAFVKGISGNPGGKAKILNIGKGYRYSALTPQGRIERFLRGTLTVAELKRIYKELKAQQQLEMISELHSWILTKPAPKQITDEQIEDMYRKLEELATTQNHTDGFTKIG